MGLSGIQHPGTLASILALSRCPDRVLNDYHGEDVYYRVVEGLDRDGDGRIDDVAVRAGFAPVLLNPINFDVLYQQQKQQQAQAAAEAPATTH